MSSAVIHGRRSLEAKIFVGIFLVVMLEGAARKWISPSLTNIALLLRDSLCIALIYRGFFSAKVRSIPKVFELSFIWFAVVVNWGLLQLLIHQSSPFTLVLGFRFWLLYPMAAVAAVSLLSKDDLVWVLRLIWYIALFSAPLAIAQHFLPPGHPINQQPDTDEGDIFRVAGDIVRTSGTFSFTLGFTCFLAIALPISLAPQYRRERLHPKWKFSLTLGMLAVVIGSMVSGSRAAILFCILICVLVQILKMLHPSTQNDSLYSAVAFFLAGVLIVIMFSSALDATSERFENAAGSEDLMERLVSIFAGEADARERFTFLGYGLGAGTNASGIMSGAGAGFTLAESEPGRVLLEAGFLGLFWLIIKIGISTFGLMAGIGIWQKTGETLCFLIWVSTTYALLTWPASGQITANALTYLLLALAGASTRHGLAR